MDYRYSTFFQRLVAALLDWIILMACTSPLAFFTMTSIEGLQFGGLIGTSIWALYYLFFEGKFGATPGKMLMKLKILDLDFDPITYKHPLLRNAPLLIFHFLNSLGIYLAVEKLDQFTLTTIVDFYSNIWEIMANFQESTDRIEVATAAFNELNAANPFNFINQYHLLNIYMFSDPLVMLFNKKRRAIHDFIAGTVVVQNQKIHTVENAENERP